MRDLMLKLDRLWMIEVEIPTNPGYDAEVIDEEQVVPGAVAMADLLHKLAFASEEELAAIPAEINAHPA